MRQWRMVRYRLASILAFAVASLAVPAAADEAERRIARFVIEGGAGLTSAFSEKRLLATTAALGVDVFPGAGLAFGVRVGHVSWWRPSSPADAEIQRSIELAVRYAFKEEDVAPEVGARIGRTAIFGCFDPTGAPCGGIGDAYTIALTLGIARQVPLFPGSRLWLGVLVRGAPWIGASTAQPTTNALVSLEL